MRFILGPVDLVDVARQSVARLRTELFRSSSLLSMTAPAELVGSWDRSCLEQVVGNLLSNAAKFGQGKPIDLRIEREGPFARLVVQDRGIGIGPEAQKGIFDPFERAVSSRNYGGLGLGLYIVKTIVEGLGGTVTVQSGPQQGATFTVKLPIERPK
jgi:signal transduction histidine kinase